MLCPIRKSKDNNTPTCLGGYCSLWNKEKNQCCMLEISEISNLLKEILFNIKNK